MYPKCGKMGQTKYNEENIRLIANSCTYAKEKFIMYKSSNG